MSFGERILEFFDTLQPPHNLPEGVGLLWLYSIPEVKRIMRHFYLGFLGDTDKRVFLIGINLNYYDVGGLPELLDDWMARAMEKRAAGVDRASPRTRL